jgi:hypothetical protein
MTNVEVSVGKVIHDDHGDATRTQTLQRSAFLCSLFDILHLKKTHGSVKGGKNYVQHHSKYVARVSSYVS